MKTSLILGTLAAFAITAPSSFSQIIIQPQMEATSKDTKIYSTTPTMNFSSNLNITSLNVGAHFLSLVQFDLASLGSMSANQITNATFTLYSTGIGPSGVTGAVGGTVTVSPILNAWRENSTDAGTDPLATYSAFFGPTPTLTLGTVAASQNVAGAGFVNWDITNLVKSWVDGSLANNGLLFQLSTDGGDMGFADVDSSPGIIGSAPSLTVVPEPSTYALVIISSLTVGWSVLRRRKATNLANTYQD